MGCASVTASGAGGGGGGRNKRGPRTGHHNFIGCSCAGGGARGIE